MKQLGETSKLPFRRRGVPVRFLSVCVLILLLSTPLLHAQIPSAPAIPAEFEKQLNKDGHNAVKHCGEDTDKHRDRTAEGCGALGRALDRSQRPELAIIAFERGCKLGNERSCEGLGHDRFASGDLARAREAWSAPLCNMVSCKLALFDALVTQSPVDIAAAEEIGMPLCDAGKNDDVCHKLQAAGSHQDFSMIQQHHRDFRIAELREGIKKEENSIVVGEGALALAQSGLSSASGVLQVLYFKGQVAMYESGIKSSRKNIASMQSELASLGSSSAASEASLGTMLGGAAMGLVAQAKNLQTGNGQAVTMAVSADSNVAATNPIRPTVGGNGGGLYNGANAAWVHRVLATAGVYSCTARGNPAVNTKAVVCQRDALIAKAQQLAWAAECSEQLGNADDAPKYVEVMMSTLKDAKNLCTNEVRFAGGKDCPSEQIIACSQLP